LDRESDCEKASTYTGQHNPEKYWQTSMPWAEFEPTIPVFKQSKTVCVLDHMAIETGSEVLLSFQLWVGMDKCSQLLEHKPLGLLKGTMFHKTLKC